MVFLVVQEKMVVQALKKTYRKDKLDPQDKILMETQALPELKGINEVDVLRLRMASMD